MRGLITDRKATNTARCIQLSKKGWAGMTDSEQAEWSGNPLTAAMGGYTLPVNLLPPIGEGVTFRNGSIIANTAGKVVIGNGSDFNGKTVTLSAETMSSGGNLALYWETSLSQVNANCTLTAAGTITSTLTTNNSGAKLVLVIAPGYYGKVMLSDGYAQSEYVPYYDIIPTEATKGAYNYSDLNRVERAVREIADELGLTVTTRTNWSVWDVPTAEDMQRYLDNVNLIRETCHSTLFLPDNMGKLTYNTANTIEEILSYAYRVADSICRCGETYCGEV